MRVLALAAALAGATMAAEAGDLGAKGGRVETPDFWTRILAWAQDWSDGFVGRLEFLTRPGTLVNATAEEGSSIDPNGGTSGSKAENGGSIHSVPPPGEPL